MPQVPSVVQDVELDALTLLQGSETFVRGATSRRTVRKKAARRVICPAPAAMSLTASPGCGC